MTPLKWQMDSSSIIMTVEESTSMKWVNLQTDYSTGYKLDIQEPLS